MTDQSLSYEQQFPDGLPPGRRGEVERVWRVVRVHVPGGYHEEVTAKFLTFKAAGGWCVAPASQRNYISLYLTPIHVYPGLRAKPDAGGKRPKRGKSCVNLRRAEELRPGAIGEIAGGSGAADYVERVRGVRRGE